jgi:hypothetical protein
VVLPRPCARRRWRSAQVRWRFRGRCMRPDLHASAAPRTRAQSATERETLSQGTTWPCPGGWTKAAASLRVSVTRAPAAQRVVVPRREHGVIITHGESPTDLQRHSLAPNAAYSLLATPERSAPRERRCATSACPRLAVLERRRWHGCGLGAGSADGNPAWGASHHHRFTAAASTTTLESAASPSSSTTLVPAPAHRLVAFEGALVAGGEPAGRPVRVTDARRRARIGYSLCAAARMTVATA